MHLQHGQLCMVVCMYAALPEHTLQCCALHANAMLCCALAASERGELRMMDLRMVPHLQANTGTPGLEAGSVHQACFELYLVAALLVGLQEACKEFQS
eukprot:scaffold24551_cov20-Tisochrysis_lutea.AAC.2